MSCYIGWRYKATGRCLLYIVATLSKKYIETDISVYFFITGCIWSCCFDIFRYRQWHNFVIMIFPFQYIHRMWLPSIYLFIGYHLKHCRDTQPYILYRRAVYVGIACFFTRSADYLFNALPRVAKYDPQTTHWWRFVQRSHWMYRLFVQQLVQPQHQANIRTSHYWPFAGRPRQQSSWGQHGAHLDPVGPRWAPCCPREPCYQGPLVNHVNDD